MSFKTVFSSSLLLVAEVLGHSWLHCSNYHAAIEGQDFDETECNGYIREWASAWGSPSFAGDLGINYFAAEGAWCQTGFSSPIKDMYTDAYPYATYYVGDTVRLVWPAKNHANYDCFANIPDTSMKLYYNPTPNQTADLSSLSDWDVLWDFQDDCTAGSDGCGFQNCPKFCENTDGAPCYGDVTIESDKFSQDGFYTIMWYWIFNGGSAPYTTCFEAFVHTAGGGGDTGAETPAPTSEDSSDSGGSGSADYIVQVPICYDGAAYDRSTLVDGANNAFEDEDEIDFSVISYLELGTDSFNATIQTHTFDSILVTEAALEDDEELCSSIEASFGAGECLICDEGAIKVYAQGSSNSGGSSGSEGEAAVVILWSIVLTIVVVLLIFGICHVLQKKNYIACTENSIVWQGSNGATATHGAAPSGATSTGASAGGAQHHRYIPSTSFNTQQARPSGPPPAPTH